MESLAVLRLGMGEGAATLGVHGDRDLFAGDVIMFSVSDPLSSDSSIWTLLRFPDFMGEEGVVAQATRVMFFSNVSRLA